MSSLYQSEGEAAQRPVFHEVPRVLHAPGAVGLPRQATGWGHARRYRAIPGQSWPGASVGVRRPEPWETPLSYAEVAFAVREGLLP